MQKLTKREKQIIKVTAILAKAGIRDELIFDIIQNVIANGEVDNNELKIIFDRNVFSEITE